MKRLIFPLALILTGCEVAPLSPRIEIVHDTIYVADNSKRDFSGLSPQEGLYEALIYYRVSNPDIVYAQAVVETGHFTSELCKKGNLFGLYDSKNKRYYTYGHWTESVVAYKEKIQSKYDNREKYYKFLAELPYASDKDYLDKVKNIELKNKIED